MMQLPRTVRTPIVVRSLLALAMLVSASFALAAGIRADVSHDAGMPVHLPGDQVVEFTLVGSPAGSFAYYTIDYPGDGRIIALDLDLAPGDPVASHAAGLNVYGPNGFFIGSARRSLTKVDRKTLYWSDTNPARWLIQVYNYLDGTPISFRLQIGGLPLPQTPTPAGAATPTPDATSNPALQPEAAHSLSLASGSLLGNRAGSFHYYKLELAASSSPTTLHLYYTADNELVSQGFGLNVYGPDGLTYAHGGHDLAFLPKASGTYLIQVYNYLHGINISYVLSHE